MFAFYDDYVWKEGKPIGACKILDPPEGKAVYRIVADPYRKWISVEAYSGRMFDRVIYDSRFLDFRKLTPTDQAAWRKESIDALNSWIFNEDDRLILKESCVYEEGMCRKIQIFSPYNTLVCLYIMPKGPEETVTLYDSNGRTVMRRIEKKWDMGTIHVPLHSLGEEDGRIRP